MAPASVLKDMAVPSRIFQFPNLSATNAVISASTPEVTRPGRLNLEVARLKWVAEGTPPPIEMREADDDMLTCPNTFARSLWVVGVVPTVPLVQPVKVVPDVPV